MEEIHIRLRDGETETLKTAKGKMTWRELIFAGAGINRKQETGKNDRNKN